MAELERQYAEYWKVGLGAGMSVGLAAFERDRLSDRIERIREQLAARESSARSASTD